MSSHTHTHIHIGRMSDNNDEENNNLLPQTLLNSSSIQKFEKDKFYKYRSNNNINDYDNNKPFATETYTFNSFNFAKCNRGYFIALSGP